jgi:2-oxoglutarate dehydrogenase E1 component
LYLFVYLYLYLLRAQHNETDEPRFTQPLMYKKIAEHPTTLQLYKRRLVENGVLTEYRIVPA